MSTYIAQIEFIKKAVQVDVGGKFLTALNRLVGNILPKKVTETIIPEAFLSPSSKDDPGYKKIEQFAKKLEAAAEGELDKRVLEQLQIYTGGPDIINDVILLKDKSKPLHKRLGGRIWHLPHTLPYKLFYTLAYPPFALLTSLKRGPAYSPPIHAIVKAPESEPVLLHEIGHALDVGRNLFKLEKYPLFKRLIRGLNLYSSEPVQLYSPKGEIPAEITPPVRGSAFAILKPESDKIPLMNFREQLANSLSLQLFSWAVKKGLIDRDEAEKILRKRTEIVPLGYYTYSPLELILPGFNSPLQQDKDFDKIKFRSFKNVMKELREILKAKAENLTKKDIEKTIQEAANLYLKSVGRAPDQIKTEDKVKKSARRIRKP
ncbi:MAG: hypothetical protein KatS3mg087_0107 [Patescibacteria group bacterium]|nr:MAG: hypothetical protein KatS3mg087_0107 [Patescibacteria group bacterium]